jgi:hypothetical protein
MAVSDGKVYVTWDGAIEESGLYFTRCPAEPDAVIEERIPDIFKGLRAYPNPFNSSVTISYSFQGVSGDRLEIFNLQGQKIRTFDLKGKEGHIEWNATDAFGKTVSSGIYFARLKASQSTNAIKLLYMK